MSSSPSNDLERLLSLTAALHVSHNSSPSAASTSLSLKQSIAVHDSLIQSVLFSNTQRNDSSTLTSPLGSSSPAESTVSLSSILKPFVEGQIIREEADVNSCTSILLGTDVSSKSNGDYQKLLVVQYLLWLLENDSSGGRMEHTLHGLKQVTLPLLLMIPSLKYDAQLRDAILDASFRDDGSDNDNDSQNQAEENDSEKWSRLETLLTECTKLIQFCTESTVTSTVKDTNITKDWLHTVIDTSSRILARLLTMLNSTTSSNQEKYRQIIFKSMHQITLSVLNATCYYPTEADGPLLANGEITTILRPVTAILLPSLFPISTTSSSSSSENSQEYETRLLEIWSFLVGLIHGKEGEQGNVVDGRVSQQRCRTWESTAPSVATGILCVLVPSINNISLPVPNTDDTHNDEEPQNQRLVFQTFIWDFLRTNLQSKGTNMKGGGVFKNTRGGGGEEDGANVDQMVRRRTIHIMGLLVDQEYMLTQPQKRDNRQQKGKQKQKQRQTQQPPEEDDHQFMLSTWKKYIMCFEALEMEEELHLIDQIWGTVLELCAACCRKKKDDPVLSENQQNILPAISWEWIGSLFARVLLSDSPSIRKLALFRFLIGRAGVSMEVPVPPSPLPNDEKEDTKKKPKGKKKKKAKKKKVVLDPAPISIVMPSFILDLVVPSFDSLSSNSGTGVQFQVDGVSRQDDLALLLRPFITNYTRALKSDPDRLRDFVTGLLSHNFLHGCRIRTLILVFEAVMKAWSIPGYDDMLINVSADTLENALKSYQQLFGGSIVHKYRKKLTLSFGELLSHSKLVSTGMPDPKLILQILALFPSPILDEENTDNSAKSLQTWLDRLGKAWSIQVGSACAASFISGDLIPYDSNAAGTSWGSAVTLSTTEKSTGASIAKLCALAESLGSTAAANMLWPAISKGLANALLYPKDALSTTLPSIPSEMSQKVARAIRLLESGCDERVLSGMGHGDLVVDKRKGTMLPPPANIEELLGHVFHFLIHQVCAVVLCNTDSTEDNLTNRSVRSGASVTFSSHLTSLMDQIKTISRSFPSSIVIPHLSRNLLIQSLGKLLESSTEDPKDNATVKQAKFISLVLAALTFVGGKTTPINSEEEKSQDAEVDLSSACISILKMSFVEPSQGSLGRWQVKAMRSMFQFSKWGALSKLVPLAISEGSNETFSEFYDNLFEIALDSVNAAPPDALLSLFETSIIGAKYALGVTGSGFDDRSDNSFMISKLFTKNMDKIINTLFAIMEDTLHNPTRSYMLEATCSLMFRPKLLLEESIAVQNIIERDGEFDEECDSAILKAFHKLRDLAGKKKPYILKYALGYLSVGWLGNGEKSNSGVTAIIYRKDIAELLVYKEMKSDEATTHQEELVLNKDTDVNDPFNPTDLPRGTPDTSSVRCFLLVFLSKLPDVNDGLSKTVLTELCHYLIFWILDNICIDDTGGILLTGSLEYSRKMRAWQSLCILARFVTPEIADAVMKKVFASMSLLIHGQIRYFLEVFIVQCARAHPAQFLPHFLKEISRPDLHQQLVSSLMIIGGNLVVGGYSADFFDSLTDDERKLALKSIIFGVTPWLGSTQGFCRAIAQLLIHKLVPLHLANQEKAQENEQENETFIRSIYEYLEVNDEMKRLRRKQLRLFDEFDADSVCSPEGIMKLSLDEGDECDPVLFTNLIKQCLIDLYDEMHTEDASNSPEWKQVDTIAPNDCDAASDSEEELPKDFDNSLINFQRKILPVDSLNLQLESQQQRKLKNAAGRHRQSLIVCATLIDKVPNLAGLARSSEIFAAEKLVIPDASVIKMDNFRSISVTAEDWIEIEECKEENLLSWLKSRKADGYTIVGVEQTSSSSCLSKFDFPQQTVLLLGKEKEGIPVQFLQVVDFCIEIPQMGVIRSLNVHVSGAIAIWEYSKQMMT